MTLARAKQSLGKPVMTDHPGNKMIRRLAAHGPYTLLAVTKGGLCILIGYEEFRVRPSQLWLP